MVSMIDNVNVIAKISLYKSRKQYLCLLTCFIAVLFTSFAYGGSSGTTTLYKNGYELKVYWHSHSTKLKVSGRIRGGYRLTCPQLNLTFFFKNRNNGSDIAEVSTFIRQYKGSFWNGFRGEDRFYTRKMNTKWFIDSFYIRCLDQSND